MPPKPSDNEAVARCRGSLASPNAHGEVYVARSDLRTVLDLLAASEARVERLRETIRFVADRGNVAHREDSCEVCYDWCPKCKLLAALKEQV